MRLRATGAALTLLATLWGAVSPAPGRPYAAHLAVARAGARDPGSSPRAAFVQAEPDPGCNACLVVDATGRRYFERNAEVPLANASTTKIATALLVASSVPLDDEVTLSQNAGATPPGLVVLEAGETFSVEELLRALLMNSSNQAAVALAEHASGDEATFVEELNAFVKSLGAEATNFVTSHGLDKPGHVSTAADLALMGAELLDEPVLAGIVGSRAATIDSESGKKIELTNSNELIGSYRGALGIKTGRTTAAGETLVGAARRKGVTLIAVALGSSDASEDIETLLDSGFAQIEIRTFARAGEIVGHITLASGETTAVVVERTVKGLVLPGSLDATLTIDAGLTGPIGAGQEVGEYLVVTEGQEIARSPVVAADTVGEHGSGAGAAFLGWLLELGAALPGASP